MAENNMKGKDSEENTKKHEETDENSVSQEEIQISSEAILAQQYIGQVADSNYNEGIEQGKNEGYNHAYAEMDKLKAEEDVIIPSMKKSSKFKSPKKALSDLNKLIVGQESAKKTLISSFNNNLQNYLSDSPIKSKSHILLAGPDNSGKEALVRSFAEVYDLPFVKISFQDFKDYNNMVFDVFLQSSTQVGLGNDYVTNQIETNDGVSETGYYTSFKKNSHLAIIYFDGLDKFVSDSKNNDLINNSDASTYFESKFMSFLDEDVLISKLKNDQELKTKHLLFVGAGSFPKLKKIVENRITGKYTAGFKIKSLYPDMDKYNSNKPFEHSTVEDFVELGFSKKFIGDFPNVAFTDELSEKDFIELLSQENSYLNKKVDYFNKAGLKVSIKREGVAALAKKLFDNNSNAGSVKQTIDKILSPLHFEEEKEFNIDESYVNKYLTKNLFNQ